MRYLTESKLAPEITLRKFLTHTSGIENDPIVFRTAFSRFAFGNAQKAESPRWHEELRRLP